MSDKRWWECPCCETEIATGTGKYEEYQARWDTLEARVRELEIMLERTRPYLTNNPGLHFNVGAVLAKGEDGGTGDG